MWRLIALFFDVDEPPRPFGALGFLMMAIFALFAAYVWFHHPVRQSRSAPEQAAIEARP